jgi:hypothetical protein
MFLNFKDALRVFVGALLVLCFLAFGLAAVPAYSVAHHISKVALSPAIIVVWLAWVRCILAILGVKPSTLPRILIDEWLAPSAEKATFGIADKAAKRPNNLKSWWS